MGNKQELVQSVVNDTFIQGEMYLKRVEPIFLSNDILYKTISAGFAFRRIVMFFMDKTRFNPHYSD